jgi:hypothetical protein
MAFVCALATSSVPVAGARAQLLFGFNYGRCLTDDEVPASERELYEKPAMQFVETIVGDKPEAAYAQFTAELQARVSAEDSVRTISQSLQAFRPVTELRIEHSYRDAEDTPGSGPRMFPCTAVAHGSTDTPQGRVMIAVMPVPLQAYVIIEGKGKNNRVAFAVWLVPREPTWRIGGFAISPATILERTAEDLWTLARQEQQRGHSLNAYLLYVTAAQLADPGLDLKLGIQSEILKEKAALPVPPELAGKPSFEWKFPNATYRVARIGPIGAGDAFDLVITHQVAQADDDQDLDRQNRTLIKAFKDAHPEYAQVFDGIVVRAVRPDGRGFATNEQNRGGP